MSSRVELADGNYELVPAQGEEPAGGEVRLIEANPVSEEPPANPVQEGKPWSMTQFLTYATIFALCLCIYVFRS